MYGIYIPSLVAFTQKIQLKCRCGKYTSPMEHLGKSIVTWNCFCVYLPSLPGKIWETSQNSAPANRSEALQRSGSPLVVPENVIEAWKLLIGWSWVQICSPQVGSLGALINSCLCLVWRPPRRLFLACFVQV